MALPFENQTEIILDSIADGIFTVDQDWRITTFNRAAEKITGIKKDEAIGRHCWEVFKASICEKRCSLRQTIETGEQIINQSIFIIDSKGERIPIVDSNVVRFYGRFFSFNTGPETRREKRILQLAEHITPKRAFRDFNYALIDFTRAICRPKPCHKVCPIARKCLFVSSPRPLLPRE